MRLRPTPHRGRKGAYSASPDPLAGLRGLFLKEMGEVKGKRGKEKKERGPYHLHFQATSSTAGIWLNLDLPHKSRPVKLSQNIVAAVDH